ncbi:sialidase family protein [Spiroplasma ixodetis]|uniref:Glycosyl hydrolase n=1 Tax=Spiroplasma ixodetis TaxID=2141 RepID=A0ABN6T1P1_9MOLU|nr:sialidase family protein [Spiroplasma ixodetis]BDT05193.1 hypothetical protein SHM_28390 [Spiroplasma ixodetis]
MKKLLTTFSFLTLTMGSSFISTTHNTNEVKLINNFNNINGYQEKTMFSKLINTGLQHDLLHCWTNVDGKIYAGAGNGLWKSTNGNTFTEIKNTGINFDTKNISSLLNVNGIIYLSTYLKNVTKYNEIKSPYATDWYKSIDGGNTFTEIKNTGLRGLFVSSLLNVDGTIYAGTNDGLWKSTDGGNTFNKISTVNIYGKISSLVTTSDGTIYALSSAPSSTEGLWKSTDGGNTFNKISTVNIYGKISSLVTTSDGTIYAGVENFDDLNNLGGLYQSIDNGNTFTEIKNTGITLNEKKLPVFNLLNLNDTIYASSIAGSLLYKQNN